MILSKTVPSPNVLSLPPNFDISILGPDMIAPDALNLSFQSPGADVSTDALVSRNRHSETDPQLHQFWDPMLNILPTMGNPDPLVDETGSARECAT